MVDTAGALRHLSSGSPPAPPVFTKTSKACETTNQNIVKRNSLQTGCLVLIDDGDGGDDDIDEEEVEVEAGGMRIRG